MSFSDALSVDSVHRRNRHRWLAAYAAICLLAGLVGLLAVRSAPGLRPVALTTLVLGAGAVLLRPILGVYLTAFLGLLGDTNMAWWYPFTKNMSSVESILFVHDTVILSPLELYLLLTFVAWGLHVFGGRSLPLRRGPLFWPLAAFTAFVGVSLLHGLATGGDAVVALWEVRPLFHLAMVYVLVTSLFTERVHFDRLMWTIVTALTLEALHTVYLINTLTGAAAEHAQSLGYLEHSASLHFNTIFVLLGAVWVYRRGSWRKRLVLPVVSVAVLFAYLPAERRSAVVALLGAAILLSALLLRENRRAFWLVVPAVGLLAAVYLAVFWNGHGALAFPAQAVKSVLAPDQLGAADQSSNLYRQIETYNVVSTIRSSPLLGLGFGHEFHQVLPLPYIPFVWAQYLPHNSVLWIWINTGIGGFVATLYLLALSVRNGVRSAMRMSGDDAALVMTAVLFVLMYVIYAYVDIAWDTQSMLYLGIALAMIDLIERLPSPVAGAITQPGSDQSAPEAMRAGHTQAAVSL